MAESVNQQIADVLTERQLRVGRFETGLRREVFAQLALLESELLSSIKSNDPTQWALLSQRRLEIQRLMDEEIDPLIRERYQHIADLLDAAMMRLATQETKVVQEAVNTATDEEVIAELPSERRLRAGVVRGLFPSVTKPTDMATFASDWWTRQGQSFSQRVGDSLRLGVSLEESLTTLAQRITGTVENGRADGLMAKARTDAARLLTTQVTNALNEGRVATGERNADQGLIAIHQSVIDSRTSDLCLARHGLQYALPDYEPIHHSIPYLGGPPYHPNCRSIMTIGVRGQGRIMQESLDQWLQRRDTAFQNEVLGPTRAQLWRDGRLGSLRDLISASTGRPLTLDELEQL